MIDEDVEFGRHDKVDDEVEQFAGEAAMSLSAEDAELEALKAASEKKRLAKAVDEAAKDFDFEAFVSGVRSARISYRLYGRPDLDVQISALSNDLREAIGVGSSSLMRELKRKIIAVKEDYFASAMDVVIEERSTDWQAREKKLMVEAGITDPHRQVLELVARQVVEPSGVTADLLEQFKTISPTQIQGLVSAWSTLQNIDPKGLPVF
ncbi:hypothetical protein [Flaviflexus equikiangi]|uniref:DUF222 domain-containing protein n=1 Tax=Flaviflexus equikiangi TaxID=2758573 RepID=A0ABS2TDF4_9ACTO|nr:hypothetical protein [Flaviflexus equikiangi]MBM9432337.1 hypothetical protein [Flaviflexus equikiangi]